MNRSGLTEPQMREQLRQYFKVKGYPEFLKIFPRFPIRPAYERMKMAQERVLKEMSESVRRVTPWED